MPLNEHEQPNRPRPPGAALLILIVAMSAVLAAAFVFKFLDGVPLAVRLFLVAGDLLVTLLACWLILRMARR